MPQRSQVHLTVCGLDELNAGNVRSRTHVLSILDPGWPEPEALLAHDPFRRITLQFHDEIEPKAGIALPQRAHVEEILAFGAKLSRDRGTHLLVHCHAGISRSTAAMCAVLAQAEPRWTEDQVFEELATIRSKAWPNWLMVNFADELLGREGRLVLALRRHYGRRLAARPELADIIRKLNRAREVEMAIPPG